MERRSLLKFLKDQPIRYSVTPALKKYNFNIIKNINKALYCKKMHGFFLKFLEKYIRLFYLPNRSILICLIYEKSYYEKVLLKKIVYVMATYYFYLIKLLKISALYRPFKHLKRINS